jgi:hypothetical protein
LACSSAQSENGERVKDRNAALRAFGRLPSLRYWGGTSLQLGGEVLLAVVLAAIAGLTIFAYWHGQARDPGVTTEASLLLTLVLGGLAMREPAVASGVAVVVAILLAAPTRLHRFVSLVLTERELHDALIFAAAVVVVLPLMPNRYVGPFGAINPRVIWKIVVLMMSVSAAGYIAVRVLGARFGLPLAGLASGFASSAATVAAMGRRAKEQPELARGCDGRGGTVVDRDDRCDGDRVAGYEPVHFVDDQVAIDRCWCCGLWRDLYIPHSEAPGCGQSTSRIGV